MQSYSKGFRKVMLIISLLALNIVEQAASAISGAIPQMASAFPQQSEVHVELVTTVVSIFVTFFVLVSGFITKWIGQKQTAVLGLSVAAVSSIIPAFSSNFMAIMVSRAVLGIGIGLANPLAISLIGEFFHGDTLANLMGWRSAVASVGVSVMTFLACQLLQISWHAAYWVYLLFIPTLVLFIIFVPSPEKVMKNNQNINVEKKDNKKKGDSNEVAPKGALLTAISLAALLLVYMSCAMVSYIKLASMYVQTGIGTPTQASTAISILGFAQLIGGALFGMAFKFFKKNVLPLGVGLSGITMILMTFSTNTVMIAVLGGLSGLFGGMAVPYIFTKINMMSTTKTAPLNNALVLVGSNLGSFVAPFFASALGGTALISLRNAGWVIILLTVIIVIALAFNRNQNSQQLSQTH
ncbi:MFS transporter [Companilactobacillus suantsaicola]|uniref:MFS transporter n=1 Tax=Companilactobacillus suantsaicola TaxID=2487723 RepID=A0A4Z0JNH6_9LACO|nr:MFS transporter [Companilactobacillus suantsaicola]TGD24625.1 MFS transporter [Companilactobacillus suantsaicola]